MKNKGFKKLFIRFSIDRKLGSIDSTAIETQSQTKVLIAISISWEISSINRNSGKTKFWKTKKYDAETPQSIVCYE